MNLHPILSRALTPLSAVYEVLVTARARKYATGAKKPSRLTGIVISIGNLTVGGTGKTPFVIYVMKYLAKAGHKAGVLTRGYRGRVHKENTAAVGLNLVSDETMIIANALRGDVRIGVDSDRYRTGKALAAAGVDWFVLDDGFQHVQLARDVDVLLMDATVPLHAPRLLPAGPFREALPAIRRADLVVITRPSGNSEVEAHIRKHTAAPIFYAETRLRNVRRLQGDSLVTDASWQKRKLFAFCGIGNPGAFFKDLERWQISVAGQKSFRDHHRFRPATVRAIEAQARSVGAGGLICTEKDRYNLKGAGGSGLPVFVCEIDLIPTDEEGFWSAFREVLARKRPEAKL